MNLRIGILGTRGIPNHYGGFEQIAGYLAKGLVERGHAVTVYNSHKHPYREKEWNGVSIVHCYDPEHKIGTAGQFIYDLNCMIDARRRNFDVILQLGYTSSSVWGWLKPAHTKVIYNMDGMEWMRAKYSRPVQKFLQFAERLAVRYSDAQIADSLAIKKYLAGKYGIDAVYIPYGAETPVNTDAETCKSYGLEYDNYFLLVARMEPENNIEQILSGFLQSDTGKHFAVVGNINNQYGQYIYQKFGTHDRVHFLGPVFDIEQLHSLRASSSLYFHGHSVGGTNPSLLEAMASKAFIVAHNNPYNRHILENDALYFTTPGEVKHVIEHSIGATVKRTAIENNFEKILYRYNWNHIIDRYEHFILSCCNTPVLEENIPDRRFAGK